MTESPPAAAGSIRAWSAPGVAIGLCVASGGASCLPLAWLVYERHALAQGQWWRLATSHLAHLNAAHWAVNAIALFLLALIFRDMGPRRLAAVLACSAAAVAAGLWFAAPQVGWYAGLSGALHGVFAGGCVTRAASAAPRKAAAPALVLWLAGCAKLAWEAAAGWPLSAPGWLGFSVVTAAHGFGYLGGSAAAGVVAWRDRRLAR